MAEISAEKKERQIDQIRAYQKDIEAFDSRIKGLTEMIQDIVDGTDEAEAVAAAEKTLADARAALKTKLMSMGNYNDAMQDLADERDSRKSARQHLSDALVVYFALTGDHQVELDTGKGREVIMSAKLGKEQLYQPSLFEENP